MKSLAAQRERNRRKNNPHATAFDATIIVDENGKVVEFNPSAEIMFGFASKDAKNPNIADFVVLPTLREKHQQGRKYDVKTAMKDIIGRLVGTKGIRNGTVEFPIHMIINPVRNGNRQLFGAFICDVTNRQQAVEKQRKLAEELAHLSNFAAMGELTTVLAHELNQPLAVISSGSQIFRDSLRAGVGDPKTMLSTAELVAEQSERAGDLIRHIRSLVGKENSSRKAISVNDLINDIASLAQLDAQRKGITVRLDLGKDLPKVFADALHIQQVVLNLVHNSVEALSENGHRPGRVTISAEASADNTVKVSVRDTGKGIPAEIRDRIFDPFFTTKPSGMGMGLAVSQTIVESHEGTLSVDSSDDGTGTVFTFTLPVIMKSSSEITVENPFRWVNQGLGNVVSWSKNLAANALPKRAGKAKSGPTTVLDGDSKNLPAVRIK